MPVIITTNATIMCSHGGRVVLTPHQMQVTAQGGNILCDPDLVGATISGCAQPSTTSSKPCMTVVSVLPGSTSLKVTVGGKPAYTSALTGMTDGVPPGTISVIDAGQTVATAS
ncbi:MAG: hypothetical protein ACTHNU_05130 [Gaiellales bacterium]